MCSFRLIILIGFFKSNVHSGLTSHEVWNKADTFHYFQQDVYMVKLKVRK